VPTHGTTRVTTHTCYSIAATTPELTIEILNSVLKKEFLKSFK